MDYSAHTLNKQYEKACKEQRIKNLKRLREEIAKLSLTEFCKQIGLLSSNVSKLEHGDRNLSLFNIQVYKTYFLEKHNINISADYLLGYTSVISNTDMDISNDLGLSGKSLEVLEYWNKLKKNPPNFAVAYGITDIDTLNLLLEDYRNLQSKAHENAHYAGFSIFHYIGNYIFANRFKKSPQNKVMYKYQSDNSKSAWIRDTLKSGDVIKTNNEERTIIDISTYDVCNNGDNGTITIFNTENSDEVYSIEFQDMLSTYDKQNILTIIDRIKERVNPTDETI